MIAWFYDITHDHRHSQDAEGCLIALCDQCAAMLGSTEVQHAATPEDADALICEYCFSMEIDARQNKFYTL